MTEKTEGRRTRAVPQWVGYLKMAVFDIGGPLAVYQLAHRSGLDQVTSLLLSGIPPLLGIALEFWLKRRVEALGVFVIVGIAIGTVLGLLTDDPRLYLLEGAAKTATLGLVVLGSAFLGKPALFLFWQGSLGGQDTEKGQWLEEQNRDVPGMRRLLRNGTLAFGVMMITLAAVGAVIAWKASVETSQFWNRIDFIPGALVFTVVWVWMFLRAQRKGEVDFETMPGVKKNPAGDEKGEAAPGIGKSADDEPAPEPTTEG